MENITKQLLELLTDDYSSFTGAINIRENCQSISRSSSENIILETNEENGGLKINIKPNTKDEKVFIPACITKENVDDLVYNDFYVGENADITIVAGCGIHTAGDEQSRHNGIHRFFIGKGARVVYEEKHIGIGKSNANRIINPVTEVYLDENSYLEMNTNQTEGVTNSTRTTNGELKAGAKLIIKERLLTSDHEVVKSFYDIKLNGDESSVNLISRSVARGNSYQEYHSNIEGNAKCSGHSECDAIITDKGKVSATPALIANNEDASLIHEAAIGKIAGEQIIKLKTLGLSDEEAEKTIIDGFLK